MRICWALLLLSLPAFANPLAPAEELMKQGRYGEARPLLERRLSDPALKPHALVLLTETCAAMGDYEDGIGYGKRAIKLLPNSSDAHYQYARALRVKLRRVSRMRAMFLAGDYKSALKKALALDPGNLEAQEEEIGFLVNAPGIAGGSLSKARQRIDELKAVDLAVALRLEAMAEFKQGNDKRGGELLRRVVELDPGNAEDRVRLAVWLQDLERFPDAGEHLGVALEDTNRIHVQLARYQLARSRILGRYDQANAIKLLREYIENLEGNPEDLPSESNAYWRLGNAYEQLEQKGKAHQAYTRAIELDAGNKQAKQALKKLPG